MKYVALAVLALSLSAPAFAGSTAQAPGAIAGGKVEAFDPVKKVIVIDANGTKTEVSTAGAAIAGQIAVGKMVDITWANGVASAIAVRPDGGQQGAQGAQQTPPPPPPGAGAPPPPTGQASVPGAIAGGKVVAFDPAKKVIVVEVNGQKTELNIGSAAISGQIAVGKIVDVTSANGVASAVAVRP